ncbi:MAG: hypothetical protein IPH82_23590 [Chloroflexi bacterium]|nr:hypothetical protein [Chloroflexota bacterium]
MVWFSRSMARSGLSSAKPASKMVAQSKTGGDVARRVQIGFQGKIEHDNGDYGKYDHDVDGLAGVLVRCAGLSKRWPKRLLKTFRFCKIQMPV